jgi:flavin reductase (DIM6/NTAB) family NADH-FMN oxidoreductase RutF
MRRVPYPVAVITATDPTGPADTTSFRGMTVSSFNTVTLTPEPVISFNVRRPSETLNALLASGRFLVHLLAPSPATATLARDFSKGNTTLASMLSGHGEFEFGAWTAEQRLGGEDERPLPILRRRGSDMEKRLDFPFVFECRLHPQKIDVHDHSIVLGTVLRAIESSVNLPPGQSCVAESPDEHSPEHLCLTYANTKFWKMGGEI